jgi:diguanylate cyclase (GGDEF)-like protein
MSYQIGLVYKERAQHQAAAEQANLLSRLSAQVPGVIYQFRMTPDGKFSAPFASIGLREMFGLEPDDVREDASPALKQVYSEDYPAFMESIAQSTRTMTPWVHEFRVNIPGQGLRWRAGNSQPERQDDGSILWHGFVTDITERKIIDEQMRHMAQHDPLTNLPNRALFMDRLEHALEQAKRNGEQLALMFVDLDNFKIINDRHGHQVGDTLLQRIATQLSRNLRASDTAARIGGDEFVVLLHPVSGKQDALTVARKVQNALKLPHRIGNLDLGISSSIGIALYPDHGHSSTVLLRAADAAMYQTEQTGRDNINVYSMAHQ